MAQASLTQAALDIGFAPMAGVDDALAAFWLRQVNLRLRREIAWLWVQRGLLEGAAPAAGTLPPPIEPLREALNLAEFEAERQAFFDVDETARYLSEQIAEPMPPALSAAGGKTTAFSAILRRLDLRPADCFVLAMALAHRLDSAIGSVFAAATNDPAATAPSLALAGRLWDDSRALLPILDAAHPLNRSGLLSRCPESWEAALSMSPLVARALADPEAPLPASLLEIEADSGPRVVDYELAVARLETALADRPSVIVPIAGGRGAPLPAAAAALATAAGRRTVSLAPGTGLDALAGLLPLIRLKELALYLPLLDLDDGDDPLAPFEGTLPALLFIGLDRTAPHRQILPGSCLPTVRLSSLDHGERVERWHRELPMAARDPAMAQAVADCARRFRYEDEEIARVGRALRNLGAPPTPAQLYAACRADIDLGSLAEPLVPRFDFEDIVLPAKQKTQVAELIQAVRALAEVHYEWGTSEAWGESGLAALFAGPPGTGKTMASEVIAREVDMPLFRIDLSQVVNKYIGETEKNLRALFDAADKSDAILFFDEADALFAKRTEVKGSNDRYANLQVNYLLQRMERFKGLAILATNRKKDLDEAFLRRLRVVIDFPTPGQAERLQIWRKSIPSAVDASTLDLAFLAERVPLAGGYIRSIVLQACLQSATPGAPRKLDMPAVIRATRRELDKLGRAVNLEQFGAFAVHLKEDEEA